MMNGNCGETHRCSRCVRVGVLYVHRLVMHLVTVQYVALTVDVGATLDDYLTRVTCHPAAPELG